MRNRTRPVLPLLLLAPAILLLPACPTVTLGTVAVKPGSVTATGFTMTVDVVVEETEDPAAAEDGSAGSPSGGRGMLSLNLPQGWQVGAARIKSPQEGSVRSLTPVPQVAVKLGEAFPLEQGAWWAWSTIEQSVPKGRWVHQVEFDVVVPKKTKQGVVGVSVGVFQEDLKDPVSPTWFVAAIQGRRVVLTPRDAPVQPVQPSSEEQGGPGSKASGG